MTTKEPARVANFNAVDTDTFSEAQRTFRHLSLTADQSGEIILTATQMRALSDAFFAHALEPFGDDA